MPTDIYNQVFPAGRQRRVPVSARPYDNFLPAGYMQSESVDEINILDGANGVGQGVIERDTDAYHAAITEAVANTTLQTRVPIRVPNGIYEIGEAYPSILTQPIAMRGDGALRSVFRLSPTDFSGAFLRFSECWYAEYNDDNFADIEHLTARPQLQGFTILGSRDAVANQHGILFYDRNDNVYINDVDFWFLKGRALMFGQTSAKPEAYLRESTIYNFNAYGCGDTLYPVLELSAVGTGDSTNEVNWFNTNIHKPYGPGLVIRNQNLVKTITKINWYSLRVEGWSTPLAAADLVTIGDTSMQGGISGINFYGLDLVNSYSGQFAFTTKAPNQAAGLNIYQIRAYGMYMTNGEGSGLNVQAGRNLYFEILTSSVDGTDITVGPSAQGLSRSIKIDGLSQEQSWTYNIDSTSAQLVELSPRHNRYATSAPGVSNDNTQGYGPGSFWLRVSTGVTYICTDGTTGAAVWKAITTA